MLIYRNITCIKETYPDDYSPRIARMVCICCYYHLIVISVSRNNCVKPFSVKNIFRPILGVCRIRMRSLFPLPFNEMILNPVVYPRKPHFGACVATIAKYNRFGSSFGREIDIRLIKLKIEQPGRNRFFLVITLNTNQNTREKSNQSTETLHNNWTIKQR